MYKRKKELLPTTIANYLTHASQIEHSITLRLFSNQTQSLRKKSIQNEGEILWRGLPPILKKYNIFFPIALFEIK